MSRGLGKVQNAILDVLAQEPPGYVQGWRTAAELTVALYGENAARANLESVRRALKSLSRAGMVELDYLGEPVRVRPARVSAGDWVIYRRRHYAHRATLAAHLALSVEEREARDQFFRSSLESLARIDQQVDGAGRHGGIDA